MAVKTSKMAFIKEGFFHMLTVGWFVWGELTALLNNFDLADAIDQPIPCGTNTTQLSEDRIALIANHCENQSDGNLTVPYDVWSEERYWFDIFCILASINFALYGLAFLVYSAYQYYMISRESDGTTDIHTVEKDRCERARAVDKMRSMFVVIVAFLSINFLILHATMLNKLRAFGMWFGSDEEMVAQEMFTRVGEDNAAAFSEDGPEASWDLSGFWSLDPPDENDPLYLAKLVKASTIFQVMNISRGCFFALVTFVASDLNIVSLIFAGIPTVFVIVLTVAPLFLTVYLFSSVHMTFAMEFDFEFTADLKTMIFGGFLIINTMITAVFSDILGKMSIADSLEKVEIEKMYQENKEPKLCDSPATKWFVSGLLSSAVNFVIRYSLAGIVALSCIGSVLNKHEIDDSALKAFDALVVLWAIGFFLAAVNFCYSMTNKGQERAKEFQELHMEVAFAWVNKVTED